jgi:hypothetical protein
MRRALLAMVVLGLAGPVAAQELPRRLGGANGPPPADASVKRPVPKLSDGTVDLSGVWTDGGSAPVSRLLKPGELDSLLLPWAKKLMASRDDSQDPYNYCMPGGPLRITGGFAWRFVQHPTTNATHIFMLQEGNAHTYRQIFMDGRKHPEDPTPSWYGHSVGRWDGDTLVIDTIGLNEWLLDAYHPEDGGSRWHSDQIHVVERIRYTDRTNASYDVTIDDPAIFQAPWVEKWQMQIKPTWKILEFVCDDNDRCRGGNCVESDVQKSSTQ